VRGFDAGGIHVGEQVVAVARDLVRVVRLAGVAVAEHVDRVAGVPPGVRAEVAGERLQMAAGAVQEDHRFTGTGLQRAGRDAAGVDGGDPVVDAGQLGPDGLGQGHIGSPTVVSGAG
jgi:hypothetical protein